MNVDNIAEWLKFVDSPSTSSDGLSPTDMHSTSVFGVYAQRLKDDIFNYLVVTLPNVLGIHSSPATELDQGSNRDTLLRVFSVVPFDMFKSAVESPAFQIGMPQHSYPCDLTLISRLITKAPIRHVSSSRKTRSI
jgi:hypothetical protein